MDNIIRWKKLDARAVVPERKTAGSAGFDLTAIESCTVWPNETVRLSTGLAVAIPEGYVGLIKPRSSSYFLSLDLDGTIDADYRGEIKLQIHNGFSESRLIKAGERVAQMVVVEVFRGDSVEVDELNDTARGQGGFGSTGTK